MAFLQSRVMFLRWPISGNSSKAPFTTMLPPEQSLPQRLSVYLIDFEERWDFLELDFGNVFIEEIPKTKDGNVSPLIN